VIKLARDVKAIRRKRNGWKTRLGVYLWSWRGGGGRDFPSPVQTGPSAHPASCTTGIGSFPGVKRPERGVDHPPSSVAKVIELYLYPSLWALMACSTSTLQKSIKGTYV